MGLERSAEASVVIARSTPQVYAFYRDLTHLPRFLGDVYAVTDLGGGRYRWTVKVTGRLNVSSVVEVVEDDPGHLVRYRVAAPLAATQWLLEFEPEGSDATRVTETLTGPFGPPVGWLMRLVGKDPQAEVPANLQRLKELLEDGVVRTTTAAIRGKFGQT